MSGPVTSNSPSPSPQTAERVVRPSENAQTPPPVARKLSAVASTGALKDLRPVPANDVAKRLASKTDEIEFMALTPREMLTPAPRATPAKIVAKVARRTAHLAMDAALILVFAPVIAGWVMIERRRRRTPQI